MKEIYHPAIPQEWKLNIDAKEYEKNMLICRKPSSKKRINCIDKSNHWPESIKRTIECFPFLDIMEFTGKEMITDKSITISLLKMFSMFSAKFTVRDDTVNKVSLICINCKEKHIYNKNLIRSSMIK